MPLEASPIMRDDDDDDDNEGMEVWLGFNPEARLRSEPASGGPSSGVDVPAQGATVSLSMARVSAKPASVPTIVEDVVVMEEIVADPPHVPAARLMEERVVSPPRVLATGPTEEKDVVPLKVPVTGWRGLRSQKTRVDVDVVPQSGKAAEL